MKRPEVIEKFRVFSTPEAFSREGMTELYAQGLLGELQEQQPFVAEIVKILSSPELEQLVQDGRLTLAMFRPRLDESTSNGFRHLSDEKIFNQIRADIQPPLEEVFSVSLVMSGQMVNEFYGGYPRVTQKQYPPVKEKSPHQSRWEEFIEMMTAGPITFSLLYSGDGQAVSNWRKQMGDNWNVFNLKKSDPDSIRARYCKSNYNNLIHGSSSVKDVSRELSQLISFLQNSQMAFQTS